MTIDELKNELIKTLVPNAKSYDHARMIVRSKYDRGYEIDYSQMYSHPSLALPQLLKLSGLFGTEDINVDDYSVGGCETCDWGSAYGHTIQIENATLNVDLLKQLADDEEYIIKD